MSTVNTYLVIKTDAKRVLNSTEFENPYNQYFTISFSATWRVSKL